MKEDYTVDDAIAIRNEADMLNLSPETIDWLAATTGVSAKLMSRDLVGLCPPDGATKSNRPAFSKPRQKST